MLGTSLHLAAACHTRLSGPCCLGQNSHRGSFLSWVWHHSRLQGGWHGPSLKPHYSPSSWCSAASASLYFTFHTDFHCIFQDKRRKDLCGCDRGHLSTALGLVTAPEVFFKSSLLTCLQKETQTCPTGWRSSRPSGLSHSSYHKPKLLSPKQTFTEKLDKNKLPLALPSALFSFLKQYSFHTDVERLPSGRWG